MFKLFRMSELRQFVGRCLILVGFSTPAFGIVSITGLRSEETPLLLQGFKTQLKEYHSRYDTRVGSEIKPVSLQHFAFRFTTNSQAALKEILQGQIAAGQDKLLGLNLMEFKRIQAQLISRGFEASQNIFWAPPEYLVLYNHESLGSQDPSDKDGAPYSYSFEFEFRLNYQPIGHALESNEVYPRAFIKGRIYLFCKRPMDDCRLYNTWTEEVGVKWDQIPGPRGGNSSAGGTSSGKLSLDKLVIDKMDIAKILEKVPPMTRNEGAPFGNIMLLEKKAIPVSK